MPYRKVGDLATVDLRFDGEEPDSTAYDLYPGRPMAPEESMSESIPRRRARAHPPPQESPIEGLDEPPRGMPTRTDDPHQGITQEVPIDFGNAPATAPPPKEDGSNIIPIAIVLILAGVGGYLIYRSMNKNRF